MWMSLIKDIFTFLLLEALLLQPAIFVNANQPYTGAIETDSVGTVYSTTNVVGGFDFSGTTPNTIPANQGLVGVLSIAAAAGTSSGWTDMYQAPVFCYSDGSLVFIPQIWQGNTREWYDTSNMNSYTDYRIYTKMKWTASNTITFYAYEYETATDFDRDTPNIYSKSHTRWTSTDTNFVVGTKSVSGYTLQFYQLGVECTSDSTDIDWQIHTFDMGYYYSSTWHRLASYAMCGSGCTMTYYSSQGYGPGGTDMYMAIGTHTFTNVQNYDADTRFSSYISPLWSDSGTWTPPVSYPFG
jgi:hypothetical protein